ncbi:DNA repair ATPase, partial [Streptomyces lonegramiae]
MDSDITATTTAPQGGVGEVDAGAYEVLRRRLSAQAGELVRRAEALNARRTEEFGSTGLRLLATEQVRTERASVPRDLIAVGGRLLFGFERGPGARDEAGVGDVLLVRNAGPENGVRSSGPGNDGAGQQDDGTKQRANGTEPRTDGTDPQADGAVV